MGGREGGRGRCGHEGYCRGEGERGRKDWGGGGGGLRRKERE